MTTPYTYIAIVFIYYPGPVVPTFPVVTTLAAVVRTLLWRSLLLRCPPCFTEVLIYTSMELTLDVVPTTHPCCGANSRCGVHN